MNKEEKNIVSFSGGKDSTAMLLMMLEKGMPIDEIVFCDTGMEFQEMYEHIRQVERYIGKGITILKPDKSFEYYLFEHKINHRNERDDGVMGYGFPRMTNRWCTIKFKQQLFGKYIKEKYEKQKIIRYIGIAADEPKRIKEFNYPLVEWGITEKEALQYCYDKGFDWGGLYEKFARLSCWCCPLQRLSELKILYNDYPEYWVKLKEWESKAYNNFRCDYTLDELEIRFKINDELKTVLEKYDLNFSEKLKRIITTDFKKELFEKIS